MATVMLCSKCGGTLGAAVAGKSACTCTRSNSGTVATAEPAVVQKHCVTCGKDVTREKRMKDSSTGKYWCYECGSKQPASKTQAIICPACKKPMSAHSMYRVNDQYICQTCHDDNTSDKGKGSKSGGSKVVILGVVIVLVAGIAAYLNDWLPI